MAAEITPELAFSGTGFSFCAGIDVIVPGAGVSGNTFPFISFFFSLGLFSAFDLCMAVGMEDLSCFLALLNLW